MERADDTKEDVRADRMRLMIAAGFAVVLHASLFFGFSIVPERPFAIPEAPIPVTLVISDAAPTAPMNAAEQNRPSPSEVPAATSEPSAEPTPVETPPEQVQIETQPNPVRSAPPSSEPLSILSTDDPETGEAIPDRWRLPDGARIPLENTQQPRNPNMEALSQALDCLGFDADCAVQRKAVFAEDQLTGTDLVWMRSYAHSGLSDSSLYGLSEAQIRERLGIPTAGENGFMILPGIGIGGPWWDALHGVNKSCEYSVGLNEDGQKQLLKRCKPLKPTSKDRIGFRPKTVE